MSALGISRILVLRLNHRTAIFARKGLTHLVCRDILLPVAFWTLSFQKMEYPNHGSKQRIQGLPPVVSEFNEESRNQQDRWRPDHPILSPPGNKAWTTLWNIQFHCNNY